MSVSPKGIQLLGANYGLQVAGGPKTLPQTATQTVFTITGGRILLTSFVGQVTTVIGGAVTLSVGVTPAGGSSQVAALATAGTITSFPVGSLVSLAATVTALQVSQTGVLLLGGASLGAGAGYLIAVGVITVTTAANQTGALSYGLTYLPYDAAASVAAN